jgi:hypothetical protein
VPVKTLPPLIDIFHELVSLMMWKLTDATPWRIYLDTAFIEGLHQVLDWKFPGGHNAMLQDLHPSFANLDHVRRLINVMSLWCTQVEQDLKVCPHNIQTSQYYPWSLFCPSRCMLSCKRTCILALEQCYVCCTETHIIEHGVQLKLV